MTRTTKTTKTQTINDLLDAVERCLAELRAMPRSRRYAARRVLIQERYADLGEQIREHWDQAQRP